MINVLKSSVLTQQQQLDTMQIWNNEYPVRLEMSALAVFNEFLDQLVDPQYYLLKEGNNILGWAATFTVEPVRSFFIIVDGAHHGKGLGTLLINHIKADNSKLFGWAIDHTEDVKANGELYPSPIDFYRKNGFTINEDLRLENDLLSAVNILWEKTED